MKYTVQEYARLAGKTPYSIYKGKRYQRYTTVDNGTKCIVIPDDIDPLTLKPFNTVDNTVGNSRQTVDNTVEAASDPVETAELRAKVEVLSADKRELQAQLDGLKGILAGKDETIATLRQQIDELTHSKAYLEGQYQQQAELLNRLTLPAPKKTLGERVKAALGIRPKEQ